MSAKIIYVRQEYVTAGMEMLLNYLKDNVPAALFVGDDITSKAYEKTIKREKPKSWEQYANYNLLDVAWGFIVDGITEYEDIAAYIDEHRGSCDENFLYRTFIDKNGGKCDKDIIYRCVTAIMNDRAKYEPKFVIEGISYDDYMSFIDKYGNVSNDRDK